LPQLVARLPQLTRPGGRCLSAGGWQDSRARSIEQRKFAHGSLIQSCALCCAVAVASHGVVLLEPLHADSAH
jgi:hypothetical protein